MNDDLSLLASAYLDDEVSADERALIEADQATMAEVDRMRSVRALLADSEPPSISGREQHLAAALSAWDRLPDAERTGALRDATPPDADRAAVAGAAALSTPTRVAERRATRTNRWLIAAAAALVMVLVGGVALQLQGGADDDNMAVISETDASAAAPMLASDQAGGAEQMRGRDSDDLATAAADAMPDTSITTGIDSAAPPAETDTVQLRDTTDLADFAARSLAAPAPVDGSTESATGEDGPLLCFGVDLVAGYAEYVDQPVIVGVVTARRTAIAYEVDRCVEVARVRVP